MKKIRLILMIYFIFCISICYSQNISVGIADTKRNFVFFNITNNDSEVVYCKFQIEKFINGNFVLFADNVYKDGLISEIGGLRTSSKKFSLKKARENHIEDYDIDKAENCYSNRGTFRIKVLYGINMKDLHSHIYSKPFVCGGIVSKSRFRSKFADAEN